MKYEKVHSIYNKLLAIEDIDPTLVYIQYMKFARRAEGIKSGRTIFKKAREDLRTRHHVYVSAALMEYYCSKVRRRRSSVRGLRSGWTHRCFKILLVLFSTG